MGRPIGKCSVIECSYCGKKETLLLICGGCMHKHRKGGIPIIREFTILQGKND